MMTDAAAARSKSKMNEIVMKTGTLPDMFEGKKTTDDDAKLLMFTPIPPPTEDGKRTVNTALKNMMDLLSALVNMTTKSAMKATKTKNQYILDTNKVRDHIKSLNTNLDGGLPPTDIKLGVDKLLQRPRGKDGAGFIILKQEMEQIDYFTSQDTVMIYYFMIELLNRTPKLPKDDIDVMVLSHTFNSFVPDFLLKQIFMCSDISTYSKLTFGRNKITALDLWTMTSSMVHQTWYGPIHKTDLSQVQRQQEHSLSFFHLCAFVQAQNNRTKSLIDSKDDASSTTGKPSTTDKPNIAEWFTDGMMTDMNLNQIYFHPNDLQERYKTPEHVPCPSLEDYEFKVANDKWAPEFTPDHNKTTQCARPHGKKYQTVVWNKPVARDEEGAPDTDPHWLAELTYDDAAQPKVVCSRKKSYLEKLPPLEKKQRLHMCVQRIVARAWSLLPNERNREAHRRSIG